MEGKEKFKSFVKNHPSLLEYVQNGDMTWQKFYEMYDMYGENESVWEKYLNHSSQRVSNLGVFDLLKNVDLDSIQTGINSMQRVISLFQDMAIKNNKDSNQDVKPRPIYKHFED